MAWAHEYKKYSGEQPRPRQVSACIFSLVFIVLNERDEIESNYPSIFFWVYYDLLQTNGIFYKNSYNKVRMVHWIYWGITYYN